LSTKCSYKGGFATAHLCVKSKASNGGIVHENFLGNFLNLRDMIFNGHIVKITTKA
jgi:hypothetical protein